MLERADVVIVGAGPAGLAAAVIAHEVAPDKSLLLLDDNPRIGGQIWRHPPPPLENFMEGYEARQIRFLSETRVLCPKGPNILLAEREGQPLEIAYKTLILATGASERFLPFPGWTLPNVVGAGGLQAMVKAGLPIAGKVVAVAGTGPLLLAVASYLKKRGAKVAFVAEQAPLRMLTGLIPILFKTWRVRQALGLRSSLWNVPYRTRAYVVQAEGKTRVERVLLREGRKDRWIACDYLATGYHLVPNTELAEALGCQLSAGCVVVDDRGETNVPGVYAVGEATGIGGSDAAWTQGAVAASAALSPQTPYFLRSFVPRIRSFANALNQAFELRPEVLQLAEPDTIVCRCEDVRLGDLDGYSSWREAKLQTRCGMGPCQGRVCGPILQAIKDWTPESVRPPIVACRVGSLIAGEETTE